MARILARPRIPESIARRLPRRQKPATASGLRQGLENKSAHESENPFSISPKLVTLLQKPVHDAPNVNDAGKTARATRFKLKADS
jgi:hypothetical protein